MPQHALTDRVIDFLVETRLDQLPPVVLHQGRRCLLDGLGALVAGMETPVGRLMTTFALEQFGSGRATILVDGRKTSAVGAAMANGFAANALDIDDGYRLVKGHPGATVLPVALAAAEIAPPVSGGEFLTAYILGYETAIRAGLIRHGVSPTYHASGTWGAVSGAGLAGRLLKLEKGQIREAMGAAEYHAPFAPMMKAIERPAMVKDGIGWGAMVALASALLAGKGFTGVTSLFSDSPRTDWVENLGQDYEIMNLYFKPWAACRWGQPAVTAALRVSARYGIEVEDIALIRVETFEAAKALVNLPPTNTEQAQYNLAFPVAAALLDGDVGPRQVLPPGLSDSLILKLMDKITVETRPEFDRGFPEKTMARVVIRTRDGRVFSSEAVGPLWEPPDGLPTDDELVEKFRRLTTPVLGSEKSRRLEDFIWAIDRASNIAPLFQLTVSAKNRAGNSF